MLEPFGEVALIFLYNLHRERSLLKIMIVIPENKCKKHEKSSLEYSIYSNGDVMTSTIAAMLAILNIYFRLRFLNHLSD